MSVRVLDTETCLFRPGVMAPEMVCLSFAAPGEEPGVLHADDPRTLPLVRSWLVGHDLLVGHHIPYDLAVICAKWPELTSLVFAKLDRDEITDTKLRQQLLDIAAGEFRGYLRRFEKEVEQEDGTKLLVPAARWIPHNYGLDDLIYRSAGRKLDKNTWRLRYGEFLHTPVAQWPEGARVYPIEDAIATLEVFLQQEVHVQYIPDQFRQMRAAFALHLTSVWGLKTNIAKVAILEIETMGALDAIESELQRSGLVRRDGSRNTKLAKERMVAVCQAAGKPVRVTDKGHVSLDADACKASEDELLENYAELTSLKAVLAKDLPVLRAGTTYPVHTSFGLAGSGRSTSSKPNVQNPKRDPDGEGRQSLRECFVPREGKVFAQADFAGLELHTLAQVCVTLFGYSHLADALNAGLDAHTALAAEMLGTTYEDVVRRIEEKDPVAKNARQAAKPINFGLPGGLGIESLISFSRKSYKVILDEETARERREAWFNRWPETREFFAYVRDLINEETDEGMATQLFSNRLRGGCKYTSLCNTFFQGLGADAAKRAHYLVTRACYAEPSSVLYGSRLVNFVHDESILEVDDDEHAHDKAIELGRVMILGANEFLPDVPARIEPLLARCWSKKSKAVYDANKRLVPWEP